MPKIFKASARLYSEFLKVAVGGEVSFRSITEKPAGFEALRRSSVDAIEQVQWYLKPVISCKSINEFQVKIIDSFS